MTVLDQSSPDDATDRPGSDHYESYDLKAALPRRVSAKSPTRGGNFPWPVENAEGQGTRPAASPSHMLGSTSLDAKPAKEPGSSSQRGIIMSTRADLLPLPSQPENLAWPTKDWSIGKLDSRVDQGTLEKLLDHAFSQPEPEVLDRTHAIVVIGGGEIVAERYAHDAGPRRTPFSPGRWRRVLRAP